MVGRNMSLKNPVTPPGIDPGTVRLVVQRLNHYATPDLQIIYVVTLQHRELKSGVRDRRNDTKFVTSFFKVGHVF
jgi:hypothetical protein